MLYLRLVLASVKSRRVYSAASVSCVMLASSVVSACCGFFFSVFKSNDAQARVVYVFLTLLVSLLAVFIIRSVFTVDFGERTKTLGLLISLGMTRLSAAVLLLCENLLYGVLGISAGIFIGRSFAKFYVGFYDSQMQLYLSNLYGKYYGTDIALRHVTFDSDASTLLITAAVCLISVFSATVTPIMRAYKLSPVESSKGQERINVNEREGIVERVCKKKFGYIGRLSVAVYINNAPRIRAASLSLSLSSVLVVTLYSLFMMRSWSNGEFNPLKADPLALTAVWMGISLTVISLICAAMLTIANIKGRARMLALLKSTGMSQDEIKKIMLIESGIIYTFSFIFGIVGSFAAVILLYILGAANGDSVRFYFPLALIAVFALLYLAFCTFYALYSVKKAKGIKISTEMK